MYAHEISPELTQVQISFNPANSNTVKKFNTKPYHTYVLESRERSCKIICEQLNNDGNEV